MGRRSSSQGCVATGNQGASRSRQPRPPGLPLNPLECGIFKPLDAPFARGRKLLILFHTRIGTSVASVEARGGDKQMNETTALSAADADIARRRTTAQLGKPVTCAGRSSRAFPEGP